MPFVPAEDTAMFELVGTYFNQVCENTLYLRDATGWTAEKLETAAELLHDWWDINFSQALSDQYGLINIKATDLTSETAPGIEWPITPIAYGKITGGGSPGNVALAVSFKTALRGRSYRGRNFISGLAKSSVVGNTVNSGITANMQTSYGILVNQLELANLEHVVVSRYSGVDADGKPIPRTNAVVTPVNAYVINADTDSMRRRLNGRGV